MIFSLFYTVKAEATEYTNNDALVNVTLENGPVLTPASTLKLKFEFDLTNKDIHEGDILWLDIPSSLELSGKTDFTFYDDNRELLATGIEENGRIKIIFTEQAEAKQDIHGYLDISLRIKDGQLPLGKNTIDFEIKNDVIPIEIDLILGVNDLSKKGVISKLADNREAIRWTMVVNRNNVWMNEAMLTDFIGDKGLTYVEGSLKVYTGIWLNDQRSSYKRTQLLTEDVDYTVSENEKGISLKFPESSEMYIVDLFTLVNDPSRLDILGSKFSNQANLTWKDENDTGKGIEVKSNVTVKDSSSGIGGNDKDSSSTNEIPDESTGESSTNEIPDESTGESSTNEIPDESTGESSTNETPDESTGESSTSETSDESTGESSTNETPDESTGESSTSETSDESTSESSTSETSDESTGESSTNETPDESTGESSTNETPDESTGESSTNEIPDESTGESSTNEIPDESTGESSTNETPDESTGESSTNETSDESTGESSTNEIPDESTGESSTNETPDESTGESSTSETSDESTGESSTNEILDESIKETIPTSSNKNDKSDNHKLLPKTGENSSMIFNLLGVFLVVLSVWVFRLKKRHDL
jgi:LPXTG-motif cell wall-anchored protein